MSGTGTGTTDADRSKKNLFARLSLFIREIVAELRKVIWPTRKELIAYTGVVLVFVLIMAGIIAAYDFIFGRGVLAVFGGD
ncbi:MAG: preprotein translocase subunit SecE [Actinomycetia bacterium]|nr:preprotein translocase subunit SecE [Actinomycetes bacterium]